MRTMLKLILLCLLLAAFVNAQAAPGRENAQKISLPECGTHYRCLAPQFCEDNSIADISDNYIVDVSKRQIYSDCTALFKIHSYEWYWAKIYIESFNEEINSIILIEEDTYSHTYKTERETTAQVSCQREGEFCASTYGPQKPIKVSVPCEKKKPIKCSFDVKLARGKKIFHSYSTIHAKVQVGTKPEMKTAKDHIAVFAERCDPSSLNFVVRDDDTTKKIFKKVQYSPESYYCEDASFKMEFREGANAVEEDVKLECDKNRFRVIKKSKEIVTIGYHKKLEIRCATEARFYCEYDVKAHDTERKVERKPSIPNQNISSELKCPSDAPHLFVNGKPMLDKQFECLNYGEDTMWTIDNIPLSETEPIVFCSKELACNLRLKIRESAVKKGKIDTNHLPTCHEDGVLHVDGERVTERRCDFDTGNFVYSAEKATNRIITDQTEFECIYPIDDRQAKLENERNAQTFTVGAVVASILAAIFLAAFIGGFVLYARNKISKERKEAAAQNEAAFLRYANVNKKRKKAYLKKPRAPPSNSVPPFDESNDWNKLLQSIQITGLTSCTTDNDRVAQATENDERVFKNLPDSGVHRPENATINGKSSASALFKSLGTYSDEHQIISAAQVKNQKKGKQ